MRRYLVKSFLGLLFLNLAAAEPSEKVILEAGKSEVIRIPSGSSIDVNPKRLVEVEAAGKGRVRLIGLKSGVALLKATSETQEKNYLIEVLSRDSQGDWLQRSEWQSYFCAKEGVRCDADDKIISGTTRDVSWYFEARKLCKAKMPCSWAVELSEAARFQAENDLKTLFPEVNFHLDSKGGIRLESLCEDKDRKRLEQILETVKDSYGVNPQVQCLLRSPDLWLLDVLVVAEREGAGDMSNPLRWERIEIPSDKPFRAFVAELSQDTRMRIVANPELSLSLGGTALLKDGQEIQTLAIQKDSEEILWKQAGFRLELKLLEFREGLARIQIHLNLSQPQAGLRTIDASEFASEVWIPKGQLLRVGRLQANLEGNEENRIPWLSAIPLLGQLFRWTSDTKAKSQVDVLLRIRPGAPPSDSFGKVDSSETGSRELFLSNPEG